MASVRAKMNHSTAEVARKVGIGRRTLLRWIAKGKVPAPRKRRIFGVAVRVWTAKDAERVRKWKAAHYRKGRGRKKKQKP